MVIKFNKPAIKEMGKKQFVKIYSKLYPNMDAGAEWDKMFPPKSRTEVDKSKTDKDSKK